MKGCAFQRRKFFRLPNISPQKSLLNDYESRDMGLDLIFRISLPGFQGISGQWCRFSGSLLYCISLILLELLSNYILIKLWQEISCPEIAKQNVAALASIRNLRNGISGCLTTTWFSSKNCSVENKTRNLSTLLCPSDTRVLSNYILVLVELW